MTTPTETHATGPAFPADLPTDLLDEILAALRSAERVQVIGHHRPDGDCIGSILAAHHLLEHLGIRHALAAGEHGDRGYSDFPGYELVAEAPDPDLKPDLALFVDCANLHRADPDWPLPPRSINIDHHGSNSRFATIDWIDANAASTAEMLYWLARHAAMPLSPDFVNAVALGLVTDTGSFRYPSVRPVHLEIAADLVRHGADLPMISRVAYESESPQAMEVMGAVFSSIRYFAGGQLAIGEVRKPLIEKVGGPQNLPENLASSLRAIRGVRVSITFSELAEGGLRASFRGDGSVNVSELAARFGGGGHPNAAGLTIAEGDYESLRDSVIAAAENAVTKTDSAEAGA